MNYSLLIMVAVETMLEESKEHQRVPPVAYPPPIFPEGKVCIVVFSFSLFMAASSRTRKN
jgi:hypothetical protein